jgi:signal peptide peptidase SppA
MDLTDFSKGAAWSILPETFDQLVRRYDEITLDVSDEQLTAAMRDARGSDGEPYVIEDGIAMIPVVGPLSKRPSFFSMIFGGYSYREIGEMVNRAADDPKVSGILLNIDSPGGVVNGTEALSDIIFNARSKKPIVAYADGNMTSAAYWLGSAAEVVVAGPTSVLGSIGVLMIHSDYSEMDKKDGIKTTYLTAGKYKAMGNNTEPLTLEAKEYFQDQLNYIYSIFVDSVSRNREVETEKVLMDMADGKLFIGQQAKDIGLADQIGTIDLAVKMIRTMEDGNNYSFKAEDLIMEPITTVESLAEAYPNLVLEVQDKAIKGAEEKQKMAIDVDRKRTVELVKIQFGEDQGEGFGKLVNSEITPDLFRATRDLNPVPETEEKDDTSKADILKALENSGAENPGPDSQATPGDKDYMAVCRDYMAEHDCSMLDAQRAVSRANPELRENYIKSVNA